MVNSYKKRQPRKLERKQGQLPSSDRILIISEGSKTEPNYFNEIRIHFRLSTANILIRASSGTDPLSVINYAEDLFKNGDPHKKLSDRAFEQVYVVFDRDEHNTYYAAIEKAKSLDNKYYNDNKQQRVKFAAIPSIPCFEIWLLLHFKEAQAPLDRKEAFKQLKRYIPEYEKGADGIFKRTHPYLHEAFKRAEALASA